MKVVYANMLYYCVREKKFMKPVDFKKLKKEKSIITERKS